ncbi:MFS transporter [Frankia sp. R82]|uniref:MFS transporter n=1 Tax=Frankia sp. R82 TaxID=2950553 RepID=UPI002042FC2A|nr:MFS transporter [Frankia sp. R82]MCM3883881.1 MFS transporter [Frankia sp. R82]
MAVVGLRVYIGSFAIGLGPMFWLPISEIYPLRFRGTAMAVTGIANRLANFVVAISYLTLLSFIGRSAAFFLYVGIAVASLAFMWLRVPETRRWSLPEIEAELNMPPAAVAGRRNLDGPGDPDPNVRAQPPAGVHCRAR